MIAAGSAKQVLCFATVADLMRATGFSRSQAYRLLERGSVSFQVFGGVRYIRDKDLGALVRSHKNTPDRATWPARG